MLDRYATTKLAAGLNSSFNAKCCSYITARFLEYRYINNISTLLKQGILFKDLFNHLYKLNPRITLDILYPKLYSVLIPFRIYKDHLERESEREVQLQRRRGPPLLHFCIPAKAKTHDANWLANNGMQQRDFHPRGFFWRC